MEIAWIWKSVLIVLGGTLLLRIAGRKSISQMTLTQTVIMVGIGSLLIQPLAGKNIWVTLGVGAILVVTLIIMEFLQIKSDFFENIVTGKSKILIHNGVIQEQEIKKLRLTVDQLEMNLRQKNVSNINDIEWATLEPNGQVGFILKQEAQPVTKREFQQLQTEIDNLRQLLVSAEHITYSNQPPEQNKLFKEVENRKHGQGNQPPKQLD
ncbi:MULTISPECIES: DUF421 domain-containing protein [Virgibacillus]|uniref:YetF C-terminal domain-containing protein n=2 Tax=Virgibacillus TaxID=84406 RepID=A0A024Q896_9BACI|nr:MULTISPECIES: DUF421 domain-containing protein [Virgibacillus]EQB38330.1 hypothetical protein M948_07055 [Virgibacillus sp. CM-4]MYL41038.1 DUF421 domain-containing protein [Virgibacillus massiliensis]GGJ53774.1 DUF421 domain-containing protein [Virgibacillus kapii]CDQ38161.1 hypothetical protein BN990_00428 [Virgibacillus massiliensis]